MSGEDLRSPLALDAPVDRQQHLGKALRGQKGYISSVAFSTDGVIPTSVSLIDYFYQLSIMNIDILQFCI